MVTFAPRARLSIAAPISGEKPTVAAREPPPRSGFSESAAAGGQLVIIKILKLLGYLK